MYKRTLEFAVGLAGAACNLIPLISIFMALSSGTQIDSPFMVEGVTIPAEVLTPVTIAILSLSTIIGLAGAFMVEVNVKRVSSPSVCAYWLPFMRRISCSQGSSHGWP